jgi:hypothetical protein
MCLGETLGMSRSFFTTVKQIETQKPFASVVAVADKTKEGRITWSSQVFGTHAPWNVVPVKIRCAQRVDPRYSQDRTSPRPLIYSWTGQDKFS